jgi:hypothetical protein
MRFAGGRSQPAAAPEPAFAKMSGVNAAIIRLTRDENLPAFEAFERAAGEAFRGLGMSLVADDAPAGRRRPDIPA